MVKIEFEYLPWCTSLFENLAQGGMWGVPRSGLVFQKRDKDLVLVKQMPWSEEFPMTEEDLLDFQEDDYESIAAHFRMAGITVRRDLADRDW